MLKDYYALQEEEDDDYDYGGGYYDYDEKNEEEDMSRVVGKVEPPVPGMAIPKPKTLKEQLYGYFTYICEARLRFGLNGNFITADGVELPLSSLIKTNNSLHPYGFKNFPGAHGSSLYSYYSNGMSFPRGGNEPGKLDDWDIVDYKPTDKYHFSIGMPQYMSDTTGGFKTIADKCLGGELFGEFELLNGTKFYSYCLEKIQNNYRVCDADNGIGIMLFDEEGKCYSQYDDEITEEKVFKFTPHTFSWNSNGDGMFRHDDDKFETSTKQVNSTFIHRDLHLWTNVTTASDGTIRNVLLTMEGYKLIDGDKYVLDSNDNKIGIDTFLSSLNIVARKNIPGGVFDGKETSSIYTTDNIPFRLTPIHVHNNIVFELDLSKPTFIWNNTIDGYIGVHPGLKDDMNNLFYAVFEETKPSEYTTKPKTWEEYCKNAKGEVYYYSPSTNQIAKIPVGKRGLVPGRNKWTLPTLELAEKVEAYIQLLSIHEEWTKGWQPDWRRSDVEKWCIEYDELTSDNLIVLKHEYVRHSLCFPNRDMANEFCKAFKDLLIKAKGLY
jgi:hypothetical protein